MTGRDVHDPRGPIPSEQDLRGYAFDCKHYKYMGETDNVWQHHDSMLWMCTRDGAIVGHQWKHEMAVHGQGHVIVGSRECGNGYPSFTGLK